MYSDYESVCQKVLLGKARPVIDITAPDTVRVRKTETDDAELWFVHNRAIACTVVINEKGRFTVFSPDKADSTIIESDGKFTLEMLPKSALMLVREK